MLSRIAEPAAVCVGASQDHVDYVLPFAYSARYQRRTRIKVADLVGYEWVVPAGTMERQLFDTFAERGLP